MHVSIVEFYLYLAYLLVVIGVAVCLYGIFIASVLIGLVGANIFCLMILQAVSREDSPSRLMA
jgi:hypothetical protein